MKGDIHAEKFKLPSDRYRSWRHFNEAWPVRLGWNTSFSWAISTRIDDNGGHILEDIACSIRETLAGRGLSLADIAGIGMGIPGLVLSGGYVEVCANLGWKDTNPQEDLSALLDCISVFCENDANIAASAKCGRAAEKHSGIWL